MISEWLDAASLPASRRKAELSWMTSSLSCGAVD